MGIPDTPYSASYTTTSQGWGRNGSANYSSNSGFDRAQPGEEAAFVTDTALCERTGEMMSAAECNQVTRLLDAPLEGLAVLAASATMDPDTFYDVSLAVGLAKQSEELEEAGESIGTFETAEIALAPWICAELIAAKCIIDEVKGSPRQCKKRAAMGGTSFNWEVSPTVDEPLTLRARVESRLGEEGAIIDSVDSNTLAITVNASAWWRFDQTVKRMTGSILGLRELLLALLAALAVVSAIIWRLKNMGAKPEKGDLEAPA